MVKLILTNVSALIKCAFIFENDATKTTEFTLTLLTAGKSINGNNSDVQQ
jgi:hypothetical protein